MRKIKIAMFTMTSVHAGPYITALPAHELYDWVAVSIAQKDRYIPDLVKMPSYVKVYETDEEVLKAHPDLDVVILAGSNDLNYEQFKLCARYGIKTIYMMKVPSLSMEEYADMQRIAEENGIIVQVELEMRADSTVKRMKELYESGAIGKLLSIQMTNTTVCHPTSTLPWVTDPKQSYGSVHEIKPGDGRYRGGALTDHPHTFDLARFFTDSEFESIYADVSPNFREGRIVEEGVFVLGKMKNGVSITIDPSYSRHENKQGPLAAAGPGWEGYPKRVEVNIVMNGEKGCIMGDCFHSGVYHTGLPYNTYAVQYIGSSDHYPFLLNALAETAINRKVPQINLNSHRNNMQVVAGCYESIYSGKVVKFD